jgi:hypothetical protein
MVLWSRSLVSSVVRIGFGCWVLGLLACPLLQAHADSPDSDTASSLVKPLNEPVPDPDEQEQTCDPQRKRLQSLSSKPAVVGWVLSPYTAWRLTQYKRCLKQVKAQNQAYLESIPLSTAP